MTIQESIRNHRFDAGISQLELSKRSGVACRNINFWESGRGNPSLNDCIRLARGMGITIEDLVCGVQLPEDQPHEDILKHAAEC